MIKIFKISINNTQLEKSDAGEFGGPNFVHSNYILSNIDELMVHN